MVQGRPYGLHIPRTLEARPVANIEPDAVKRKPRRSGAPLPLLSPGNPCGQHEKPATPRVENVAGYTAADLAVSGDAILHGQRKGYS